MRTYLEGGDLDRIKIQSYRISSLKRFIQWNYTDKYHKLNGYSSMIGEDTGSTWRCHIMVCQDRCSRMAALPSHLTEAQIKSM